MKSRLLSFDRGSLLDSGAAQMDQDAEDNV